MFCRADNFPRGQNRAFQFFEPPHGWNALFGEPADDAESVNPARQQQQPE
jgi:hypothetical protein